MDPSYAVDACLRELEELEEQLAQRCAVDFPTLAVLPAERTRRIIAILESSMDLAHLSIDAVVVRAKIARLAESLDDPKNDDCYRYDTIPNLLLLERLIERLHPLTAAALREELAPLFGAIDPPFRLAMNTLVEAGLAPSPFCVAEEEPPRPQA